MTDVLTKSQRSFNMSRIRSKDTRPEIVIRSLLFKAGYRYRLHAKKMPGKPDIIFPSQKKAIQVNGCFWHYHNCRYGRVKPESNSDFWELKRLANKKRDLKNVTQLRKNGWQVLTVWECQVANPVIFRKIIKFMET